MSKAILEFNLPEDREDFEMATNGKSMYNVLWEMDQWLRIKTKYAPDNISSDTYDAYDKCREQLGEFMGGENISFD